MKKQTVQTNLIRAGKVALTMFVVSIMLFFAALVVIVVGAEH